MHSQILLIVFRLKEWMYIGQNTSLWNYNVLPKFTKLLVVPNSDHYISRKNSVFFSLLACDARNIQNLCRHVLQYCGQIDRSIFTQAVGISASMQHSFDIRHRKQYSCLLCSAFSYNNNTIVEILACQMY